MDCTLEGIDTLGDLQKYIKHNLPKAQDWVNMSYDNYMMLVESTRTKLGQEGMHILRTLREEVGLVDY